MTKAEFIERYGEAAWERKLEQAREWERKNPEKVKAKNDRTNREKCRKEGKHYVKHLKDNRTGLQGARNKIRKKHATQYRPLKRIIAPESQIHHEWCFQSAEYTGVALVEKDQHMHGYVDVIQILDGKITLLTEEEVKKGGRKKDEK